MEKNPKFELGDHQIQSAAAKSEHDQDHYVDTTLRLTPLGIPPPPPPPVKQEDPESSSRSAKQDLAGRYNISISREVVEWWSAAPAVQAAVASCGGGSGLKLGWHTLAGADFGARLVVDQLWWGVHFWKIFTPAEQDAVRGGGDGAAVVGVDADKRVYPNLRVVRRLYEGMAIEGEWSNVIAHNKPKIGNVVEFWGFSVEGKPHLAFHFREETQSGIKRKREYLDDLIGHYQN